jgi:hypothetical protein
VSSKDVFDLIGSASSLSPGLLTQHGDPLIFDMDQVWHDDTSDAGDGLARFDSITIDPQEFTERVGISPIGFDLGSFFWLDQNDVGGSVLGQSFEQPIVKPTDFDDGKETTRISLLLEFSEEFIEAFRFGTDLPIEDDVPLGVSQRESELFCVLVDSKVQHGFGSPSGT